MTPPSSLGPLLPPGLSRRYEPRGLLGEGGMGRVVAAFDLRLKRPVAVKLLRGGLVGERAARERFHREARLTASLVHPNVVRIFDHGFEADTAFAVFELVDGIDLRRLIDSEGPVAPGRAVEMVLQVLDALESAHAQGIVHRDIKPANVLLTADGQVKVADFGIARAVSGPALTEAGAVLGTPGYLAPEQLAGAEPDPLGDIYSAAALLYELILGTPPFHGGDVAEVLARQSAGPPEPLLRAGAPVAAGLSALVQSALSPEPARRPRSAAELAARLRGPPDEEQPPTASTEGRTVRLDRRQVARAAPPEALGRNAGATVSRAATAGPVEVARSRRPRSIGARVGLAAAILLCAAAVSAWLSRGDPSPGVLPDTAAPAAVFSSASSTPTVTRTAVAWGFWLQESERMIRLHFLSHPAAAYKVSVTLPDGTRVASVDSPGRRRQDVRVPGLAPSTEYRIELGPAEPDWRIVADGLPPRARTLRLGAVAHALSGVFGADESGSSSWLFDYKPAFRELEGFGEPALADRILQLLPELSPDSRGYAVYRLQFLVDGTHETRLRKLLLDDTPGLDPFNSVAALAQVAGLETARVLLEHLSESKPAGPDRRAWGCAIVLSHLAAQDDAVRRLLLDTALREEGALLAAAAQALAVCGDRRTGEALDPLLDRPLPAEVARSLRMAVSRSSEALARRVSQGLETAPRGDWEEWRRYAGLLREGAPVSAACRIVRSEEVLDPERRMPKIASKMGKRWRGLRKQLAELLGVWGGEEARRTLLEILASSENAGLRSSAALGLAAQGVVEALPHVAGPFVGTDDEALGRSWMVAGWLAGLPGADVGVRRRLADHFRGVLRNPDAKGRPTAAWGLGRSASSGNPASPGAASSADLELLETLAATGDSTLRARALEGLYFLDRARCAGLLDRLEAGGESRGPAEKALRRLCEGPRAAEYLYVPSRFGCLAVGPALRAGTPIEVAVLGAPSAYGSEGPRSDSEFDRMSLRHGGRVQPLSPGAASSGVMLEDGRLAVEPPAEALLSRSPSSEFYTVLVRTGPEASRTR